MNGREFDEQGLSPLAQLAKAGVLLVLALTVMEPASAFGMAWWERAAFYAAHVGPAMVVAWWCSGWLFNRSGLQHWPAWVLLALAGAAAGLVLAPWSVALEMSLGVVDLDEPDARPLPVTAEAWRVELADELLLVPPRTALFWVAMNLWVLWRTRQPEAAAEEPVQLPETRPVLVMSPDPMANQRRDTGAAAEPSGLLHQLPARLGRDVVQLEAQQHYLRVVTTRGEHLVLHGFAPAVADMARSGIPGMQIHRSIWVAWVHVKRLDLRPGSWAAVLHDGRRLPIGRRRVRDVAQAWDQWPGES